MNNQQPQGLTKRVVNPTDSVINLEISEADGIALANSLYLELDDSVPIPSDLSIVINPALLRTHNDNIALSFKVASPQTLSLYFLIDSSFAAKDKYKEAPVRQITVNPDESPQPVVISCQNGVINFVGVALEPIEIDSEKNKLLSAPEKEKGGLR